MKEKRTSLPKNAVKISGNLETVEDAVLGMESLAVFRGTASEESSISSLRTDKNRAHIYLGAVSDIDVVRKQRGEFFTRIDGSYYGSTPRVDADYTQGDYFSGLAQHITLGFMPASFKARDKGDDQTADALETLAQGITKKSVMFGYVNDNGVPCGMQIVTFTSGNQSHYIISHTEHLDKPRSERQASVYMNPELYQLLNDQNMLQVDAVVAANPGKVKQTSLSPQELSHDLYATVNHGQLNQELQGLFGGKKPTIQMSHGGEMGQNNESVYSEAYTPISSLPEKSTRPVMVKPHELFRQAEQQQIKTATRDDNFISSDHVSDLINHQWTHFISNLLNNMPVLEKSSMPAQLFRTADFKQKLVVQQLCTELEKLRIDIANGRVDNPAEAVGKILDALAVSNNPAMKDFVAEQRVEFKLMTDFEGVYEHHVRAENTAMLRQEDPAPANELANSGSITSSEAGDDPEDEPTYPSPS